MKNLFALIGIGAVVTILLFCTKDEIISGCKSFYGKYKELYQEMRENDIDIAQDALDSITDKCRSLLNTDSEETEEVDDGANDSSEETINSSLEEVIVERVVDGDTIVVIDGNGNSYKVRLIGVDTPESVNPDESKNTEEGVLASDYTKSRLLAGDTVYLQYDEEKTDIYSRTLAYVWLSNIVDVDDIEDIINYMYNAELIIQGYAEPKVYEPNTMYADVFQALADLR